MDAGCRVLTRPRGSRGSGVIEPPAVTRQASRRQHEAKKCHRWRGACVAVAGGALQPGPRDPFLIDPHSGGPWVHGDRPN